EGAKARLEAAGLEHLRVEVDKRGRELALVALLEKIRLKASRFAYFASASDFAGADRAYAEAFAQNGLDMAALAPAEIAHRIRASGIRSQLIYALDHWADFKDSLAVAQGAAQRPLGLKGEPLRAIARLADDDAWRNQLRDPLVVGDPVQLAAMAEDKDV